MNGSLKHKGFCTKIMFLKILLNIFHFSSISHCLRLENDEALLKLINITGFKLEGLGFLNTEPESCEQTIHPFFLPYLSDMCENIVKKDSDNSKAFAFFPNFKEIYSNCRREFMENQTCFATCIFYGIIAKEKYYGLRFIFSIKNRDNLFYDESAPFPHWLAYEFNADENLFCLSPDYRKTLLNNIVTCKLLAPKEFCIIDESDLHCDPNLGNCDFDESEASVISSGNKAHVVTCGTLDSIKWKYFENSTKLQCILPGKKRLLDTHRKVFKDCHVCTGRNKAVIEFPKVPTKKEFSKVVYSARPVIIRNGATFEGIPPLNFSVLKEIYQDFHIGDWKPCKLELYNTPFDNFSHALSKLTEKGSDDLFYMRWGICDPKIRMRFGNLIKSRLSFLPDDYPKIYGSPWVYAASPDRGQPSHYDYFREITWQAQLSGNKKWRIGAPPECKHVCTEIYETTVNKGDLISIYTNTWLHGVFVEGGDPSMAIAIEYEMKED